MYIYIQKHVLDMKNKYLRWIFIFLTFYYPAKLTQFRVVYLTTIGVTISVADFQSETREHRGKFSKEKPQRTPINQPTTCNNIPSLLLDIYVRLNMFLASSRPSSGAQQLQ